MTRPAGQPVLFQASLPQPHQVKTAQLARLATEAARPVFGGPSVSFGDR